VLAEYQLVARARIRARHWPSLARVLPPVVSLAIAAWIVAPRFSLGAPSLVDDWYAVTYSKASLQALLHGHYLSSGLDFDGRYRPAYSGVWSYVQWHLLGGPSPVTAAAWDVLRVALFLLAVWMLTAWLAEGSSAPRAVYWLAPLAVALTPAIAVDLARFGPGEPMMVAGLILGLALISRGVRLLILSRSAGRREQALAVATITAGYLVYLLGVYTKETSLCLLVFVPFFLKWLGRARRNSLLEKTGRLPVLILGVLLTAPLVHVATRLALAVLGGANPYPNRQYSVASKLFSAGLSPLLGQPPALGTWIWLFLAPASILVALNAADRRHRDAWLLFGVLATGFLMSALALVRGPTPGWYYIPWLVAVAAVAIRGLSRMTVAVALASAFTLVLIGLGVFRTQPALDRWAQAERSGSSAIDMTKSVIAAKCPLYLANFDIEQRVAIPLLLRFGHSTPMADCTAGSREAYALSLKGQPLSPPFAAQCGSRWQRLRLVNRVRMLRCSSFRRAAIPDQIAASGDPLVTVVRLRIPQRLPRPSLLFRAAS
jgi:hypothetical protein